MRLQHLERFQPVCPNCLASPSAACQSKLFLARVIHESDGHVLQGILQCSQPTCSSEFPIIDGIPIILSQLRSYISDNLLGITARGDLSPEIESLIGDCCSQSSLFDSIRQHSSCYAWDHYGQFGPDVHASIQPGSIVRLLDQFIPGPNQAQESTQPVRHACPVPMALPSGLTLDLGCSVGRNCFELADRTGDLVLGIDMNIATLRLAAELLRTGQLSYSLRRIGLVYDRQSYKIDLARPELADFWLCDAQHLPFARESITNCVAFNLLDAVSSPLDLLHSMARVMQAGGHALVACPYDWSVAVTPLQSWLGGHSQRGANGGDPVAGLRVLINQYQSPAEFSIAAEIERLPWTLRLHDRSTMSYEVHGMRLVRNVSGEQSQTAAAGAVSE